jgi:hypothetical protein
VPSPPPRALLPSTKAVLDPPPSDSPAARSVVCSPLSSHVPARNHPFTGKFHYHAHGLCAKSAFQPRLLFAAPHRLHTSFQASSSHASSVAVGTYITGYACSDTFFKLKLPKTFSQVLKVANFLRCVAQPLSSFYSAVLTRFRALIPPFLSSFRVIISCCLKLPALCIIVSYPSQLPI